MKNFILLIFLLMISFCGIAQTYSDYGAPPSHNSYLILLIAAWVFFSAVAGVLAIDKQVGFLLVFIASIVLSPVVGVLFAMASRHKSAIAYEKKTTELLTEIAAKLNSKT